MNLRVSVRISRVGVFSASALMVIYGLWHLSGAWAFVIGSLFLGTAACVISKIWSPLPKSFWWYCALFSCLGLVSLLIIRSATA